MAVYRFLRDTGVVVADTEQTRADVIDEMRAIQGWGDMVTDPETPTGALVTAETLRRDAIARGSAQLANQINPSLATGAFLDALCGLTGLERKPGTGSIAAIHTDPDGIDPMGLRYMDSLAGTTWVVTFAIKLDHQSPWSCTVQCEQMGPIELSPKGIDKPLNGAPALDPASIGGQTVYTLGVPPESDRDLKRRRESAMAGITTGSAESMQAAIEALPFVERAIVLENHSSSPQVIGKDRANVDILMDPHTILPIIDLDVVSIIAVQENYDTLEAAIFKRKPVGIGFTTFPSVSPTLPWMGIFGYTAPVDVIQYPTPIQWGFLAADEVAIKVSIFVKGYGMSETLVKSLIMRAIRGTETWRGLRMGDDVLAFELGAALNELNPSIQINLIEVKKVGETIGDAFVQVEKFQKATLQEDDITVTLV